MFIFIVYVALNQHYILWWRKLVLKCDSALAFDVEWIESMYSYVSCCNPMQYCVCLCIRSFFTCTLCMQRSCLEMFRCWSTSWSTSEIRISYWKHLHSKRSL